jgi:cation diffusion facilitator CzcD-associated flavoprotein CzcO
MYFASTNKHKINKQAIIIGSGISGIAAAYYLQKKHIPYIILEGASELGGTWRDLKFHGSRVDTKNIEYCYSFNIILNEKTVNWSRIEVMDYLLCTAKKFGIFEFIKFNKVVNKVNYDSAKKKWFVSIDDGSTYCADFLYNCSGFSNTMPYIPEFKGVNDFQGDIIHCVKLHEAQTFYDKKVVLIGSGATMASTVTSLVKVCKNLTIIQRSPSYIYETDFKPDLIWRLVVKLEKLGIPRIKNIYQIYRMIDGDVVFTILRNFQNMAKRFFRMQWEDVADKEFIDTHLTPRYKLLEQRIPVSSGLKELIKTKTITFETGEISHFTKNAIVMKSQKSIPCDVCILATGFDMNFFRFPITIDGAPVDTKQINWYKGLMLGGIPNYFQAVGCFDCSWTQRIESAYNLSTQIIEYLSKKSLNVVQVPKRIDVKQTLVFKPNFILRKTNVLPIVYGLKESPTYDYFFSFHLAFCKELVFSE